MKQTKIKNRKIVTLTLSLFAVFILFSMTAAANEADENIKPFDSQTPVKTTETFFIDPFNTEPPKADSQTPDAWYPDRYPPAGFNSSYYDEDNRLNVTIDKDDYLPHGTTFHNYQGRKYDLANPINTYLTADLYIGSDWETNNRHASLWATTFNETDAISGYPIFGFTNGSGFKIYSQDVDQDGNDTDGDGYLESGWYTVGFPTSVWNGYDAWYTLEIKLTASSYKYYINDELVWTDIMTFNSQYFGNMMLQGYNYNETYNIYWDNVGATGPVQNIDTEEEFSTIQAAIDDADTLNGHTIHVDAGIYNEQVTINKAVSIIGEGPSTTIIDGDGLDVGWLVRIPDAADDILFEGFTVKNALDYQMLLAGGSSDVNITIKNNLIIGNGAGTGTDYGFRGSSGLSNLLFTDNTVINCAFHCFFLERWLGPTEVCYNYFENPSGTNARTTGFMTYETISEPAGSQDVTTKQYVHHNEINSNDSWGGIMFIAPYGYGYNDVWSGNRYDGGKFTNIEISNNTIYNQASSGAGIQLEVDGDYGGIDGALITDNTVSAMTPGQGRGVRILAGATNATVINNEFNDLYVGIYQSYSWGQPGAVGPKDNDVHYNNFFNCEIGIENQYTPSLNIVEATCNWWGDITGPYHSTDNPSGMGCNVSDNVNYIPWLDKAYPDGDCVGGECADPVYVDDDAASSWYDWSHVASIQTAVDRVCEGGTIYVEPGVYTEQVFIDKSLTLHGNSTLSKPILNPPNAATRTTVTIPESTRIFDPIIFINGGSISADVTIGNLEIDGLDDGGSNNFNAILGRNVTGLISSNDLKNLKGTGQETNGITFYGPLTDIEISDNTVTDFSRNGITAIDGYADVINNVVTGDGPLPQGYWAQNGIELGYGASGSIIGNTVSDISFTGGNWAASAILPLSTSGTIEIHDNILNENQVSIYLGNCQANISGNQITATASGVGDVYYYGIIGDPGNPEIIPDYSSMYTKEFSNPERTTYTVKCTENNVLGDGSPNSTAIGVYAGMYGTYNIDFTAEYNTVQNCNFGFELYAYASNILTAELHYNNIVGNTYGVYNYLDTYYDATCNWWGSATGPLRADNPSGTGDYAGGNLTYVPWLDDAYPDGDCIGGECVDTIYVDDDAASSWYDWDHVATIQTGINRACVDGIVNVYPGTYNEQVTINKAVSVIGEDTLTTIIDGDGLDVSSLVSIPSAAGDILFEGFTVKNALDYQMVLSGGSSDVDITIKNNLIIGNGGGPGADYGLYGSNGLSKITFRDNNVDNCNYHSFFLERWQGPTEVCYNEIVNGPQSGPGIGFMTYENPGDANGSKDVTTKQFVHHNDVDVNGSLGGIMFIAPFGWSYNEYKGGSYTNIEISNNTVYNVGDSGKGIQLEVDGDGGGIYDALIADNDLTAQNTGAGTSRGIRLLAGASNTSIVRNTITGFYRGIYQSYSWGQPGIVGPIGNEVHYNNFIDCTIGIENQYTTVENEIDATCNWWGDITGPYHPTENPIGIGCEVTDNVIFLPWLTDEFPYGDCNGGLEALDIEQTVFDRGFPIRHATDGDWGGAQSFIPTTSVISSVDIYLRMFGTPSFDLTVELREDDPEGTLIDTVTIPSGSVPTSWTWLNIDFEDTAVESGTDYFIVLPPAPSGTSTSFGYEWGYAFGNQYDDGSFWFTRDGGDLWRDLPTMYEFSFKTYGY